MELYNILTEKDREILKNNGKEIIEKKEYKQEEIRKILVDIEDEIVSCSIKNDDMNNKRNQYYNIINVLEKNLEN